MAKKKTPGKSRSKLKPRKQSFGPEKAELLPILGLVVLAIAFFIRTSGYDFVNWDDDFNIAKNPNLRYFDWANIKGIFTTHVIGNYNPLTTFTFAVENHFFGLKPGVFHTTNVILHAGCVYFFYRLVRLLGLAMWPSVVAAAVFEISHFNLHPVHPVLVFKDPGGCIALIVARN
jgi:hypothetical protein